MAYGSAKFRTLECLTCSITFRRMIWRWDDPTDPRNTKIDNAFHPDPLCDLPHLRFAYDLGMGSCAQVRESQRAVIYRFPDGTWAAPGSNDPNDPVAQKSIRDGAVREEMYHLRDLRSFNRERMAEFGGKHEGAGYNEVLDYDYASLLQRDTLTPEIEQMHERDRMMRYALQQIGGAGSQGKYEKVLKQYRDRR